MEAVLARSWQILQGQKFIAGRYCTIYLFVFVASWDKAPSSTTFIYSPSQTLVMKNVLVLTTTFPRWRNDSTPSFVFALSNLLAKKYTITVLAPHAYNAAKNENMHTEHLLPKVERRPLGAVHALLGKGAGKDRGCHSCHFRRPRDKGL